MFRVLLSLAIIALVNSQSCSLSCHQNGVQHNPNNKHSYIECTNGRPALHHCPLSGDGYNRLTFDGQTCREKYNCPVPNGVFPHPHNDLYWSCDNGMPAIKRCANGQVFSSGYGRCLPRFDCPDLSGNYANPRNTSEYYKCCMGEGKLYFCPNGYLYEQGDNCVPLFLCPQPNGKYRNVRNESQYYHCTEGVPHLTPCPAKHAFDGLECAESFDCPLPDGKFYNILDKSNRTYYVCRNNKAAKMTCPVGQVFYGKLCEDLYRCPKAEGRFKHPHIPSKYYLCEKNFPYPHDCPDGLVFSENAKECQKAFQCPAPFGRFKHPENRTMFYECDNYVVSVRHCSLGKYFDGTRCTRDGNGYQCPGIGMYRHPTDVNKYYYCGTDLIARLQECSLGYVFDEALRTCTRSQYRCPQLDGRFPHPHSDRHYFECRGGSAQLLVCPSGQKFDKQSTVCRNGKPVYNCPQTDGLFSHPSNRSLFYHCLGGVPHLRHCGQNKIFDQNLQNCITEANNYLCPQQNGRFPYQYDDRRYYFCQNDIPYLRDCPNGERFDPRYRTCLGTDDHQGYRCVYPEGLFPYPSNKNRYYLCENGIPQLMWCPSSQQFEPQQSRCIDPDNNNNQGHSKCPKADGLFKHETNQSRFYHCKNYHATLRECREQQIFDEQASDCIPWPWPHTFYCPVPNGLFINPQNNSEYFECCQGQPTLRSCPNSQIFNGIHCISEIVYSCENKGVNPHHRPQSLRCHNGHRYRYTCPYVYGKELVYNGYHCVQPYRCPIGKGEYVIRNPVHSHQYYRCSDGVPTLYTCSRGFQYDNRRGCCVYSEQHINGYFGYNVDDRTEQKPVDVGPKHTGNHIPSVVVEPVNRPDPVPYPAPDQVEFKPITAGPVIMTQPTQPTQERIPTMPEIEPAEVRVDEQIKPEQHTQSPSTKDKDEDQDNDDYKDEDADDDDLDDNDYKEEDEDEDY